MKLYISTFRNNHFEWPEEIGDNYDIIMTLFSSKPYGKYDSGESFVTDVPVIRSVIPNMIENW